jgi:hypothetical protein
VTELEKPGTGAKTKRSRGRNRRWPAVLGGLVLAGLKSEVLVRLILHRGELIALLAVVLMLSLLRGRPVGIAVGTSLLLAFVVGAHSLGLGLALGFGGFALLMALFFAISTVLLARQNRTATRANVP